jgi:hypothetical protein
MQSFLHRIATTEIYLPIQPVLFVSMFLSLSLSITVVVSSASWEKSTSDVKSWLERREVKIVAWAMPRAFFVHRFRLTGDRIKSQSRVAQVMSICYV